MADYATAGRVRGPRRTRATRATSRAARRRAGRDAGGRLAGAAHVVTETIWQQAYAAVPMETRGIVAEWTAASGELTIWAATQAPHEVRMFSARLLGLPEHRRPGDRPRRRRRLRPEGRCRCARTCACCWPARKLPAAVKWIEDRQENLMAAGQARHEHGTAGWRSTPTAIILAAALDHVQDVGAYPTPWPVGTGAAVGHDLPRVRTGCPAATFSTPRCSPTPPGRTAYRGPWQFEPLAREVAPRHRRPPDGDRPGRAAAPQPAARGRACRSPTPTACPIDHMSPARDARAGPGDARLRRLPQPSRPPPARRAATWAWASPATSSPPRAAYGYLRHRGRDHPHRVRPARSTSTSPADPTGNSIETTVDPAHRRRARRRHRRRGHRSRATPR